jgi:hypothetical protein
MDHHRVPPSGCRSSHRHSRTFRRINLAQVQSFPGDLANTAKSISLSSQRHNRLGLRIKLLYYSQKTQRGTCGAINCMQRNYETRSVYMQSSQNDDKRIVRCLQTKLNVFNAAVRHQRPQRSDPTKCNTDSTRVTLLTAYLTTLLVLSIKRGRLINGKGSGRSCGLIFGAISVFARKGWKNTKGLSQDSWYRDRDLNPGLSNMKEW